MSNHKERSHLRNIISMPQFKGIQSFCHPKLTTSISSGWIFVTTISKESWVIHPKMQGYDKTEVLITPISVFPFPQTDARLLSWSTWTKTLLASSSSSGTLVVPSLPNSFLNCSSLELGHDGWDGWRWWKSHDFAAVVQRSREALSVRLFTVWMVLSLSQAV